MELKKLTIKDYKKELLAGSFTCVEATEHFLKKIEENNPRLNAYLGVFEDSLESAKKIDEKIKKGESNGSLLGVPFSIKDNILIKGKNATSGSKILEGFKAPYSATVIQKLKNEGAIFLGRANLDEFAMGGSTENSGFGVTRNPLDEERVPGGSSGGSAASVASGMALASLGSDTGGSVRQPASFCGVVGLKPTYGSVSRYGLMAMGSSLDVIGPITKTVEDNRLVYEAIKGKDKMDSASVSEEDFDLKKNKEKDSFVIGVPKYIEEFEIDEDLKKVFYENIEKLKELGHKIEKIEFPHFEYSLAVYYIIMPAEASTNLARFDGVKYGAHEKGANLMENYLKTRGLRFGKEVKRRILLGTYALSAGYYDAYYKKARMTRDLIAKDYINAFSKVDIIATPTAPTPAFKIGEKADPLSMYMSDIFTVPANLAGVPAISVPMGNVKKDEKELPVGIQFVAPHMREDLLFKVGNEICSVAPFYRETTPGRLPKS